MADEIGELDLTAQANAAKVASNYISADDTGIRIANASPATATTYQHQTATETEFVVDNVSRASISGDGARFGKAYVEGATDNESHLELDYRSLRLADKEGDTYAYLSDLRNNYGVAVVSVIVKPLNVLQKTHYDMQQGKWITETHDFGALPIEAFELISITADGEELPVENFRLAEIDATVEDWDDWSDAVKTVDVSSTIDTVDCDDSWLYQSEKIIVECATRSPKVKAYTFGTRPEGSELGPMSIVGGPDCVATDYASVALGNGTISTDRGQLAIGCFNKPVSGAFVVGNGSDSNRQNLLLLDWSGYFITQGMAGMIQMYAGWYPPTGWLECDGSAVSREDYAILFAAIGTTWGSGDGSTTFNLPDLRGRGPIGDGAGSGLTSRTLGIKGGSEHIQAHTHSFTNPKIPNHVHSMTHQHHMQSNPSRYIGYNYGSGSGMISSGVGKVRVAAASSGTNYVPRIANADVDFSGADTTGNYTGNSGNPTSLGATTGGAVGAVSGATTGGSGNMQPFAVVKFIICTGKTS